MTSAADGGEAGVVALQRVRPATQRLDRVRARRRRPRRPGARGRPAARRPPAPRGVPESAAISSSPLRRQVSAAGTVRATRSGIPSASAAQGRMKPTAAVPIAQAPTATATGSRVRRYRSWSASTSSMARARRSPLRHPARAAGTRWGEAVVEPHAPAGSARAGRHRDRRAALRSAGARAGRRAPRPRPGCRRSRAGPAAGPHGRPRSPTRPGGRWSRRRRPARGDPPAPAGRRACPARRVRGAAILGRRPALTARPPAETRRRRAAPPPCRSGGGGPARAPPRRPCARRARARAPAPGVRRSADRATRCGSSSSRIGAGHSRARASATRWRSPELSVRPSWPRAVCNPAGRLAMSSDRPTAPSTACRSSSGASGAPEAQVLRHGGVEEVGSLREPREVAPPLGGGSASAEARPADGQRARVGLHEAQQGREHGRLARSRGPRQRDPGARRGVEGEGRRARGGRGARTATATASTASSGRRRDAPAPGAGSRRAPVLTGADVPSTSRTRAAAACPSVLAWNSAPARRRGMKISGATSRTAMAVCRLSSPHRQAEPEDHRHEADPEAGDHVHGEGREEGDPQRAHRGRPHALGGRGHLAASLLLADEGPQGREPFDRAGGTGRRASPAGATGAPTASSPRARSRSSSPARRSPAR